MKSETLTFGIQAVHHTTNKLQLILKAEVDEVGIDQNSIWRNKSRIMSEEKRRHNWSPKRTWVKSRKLD